MNASRRERRSHLDHDGRVGLLEDDVDDNESELHAFRAEIREEMKWLRRTLVGFLVTIALSAIGVCFTIVLVGK